MNPEKNIETQLEQLAQAIPSGDSFVNGVMSRLETSSDKLRKQPIHINLVRRLFMKTTVKFAAAAIILIAAFLSLTIWDKGVPNVMASEVLTSAIEAVQNVYSVHIKAQLRTRPQENFSYINPELDFVSVEMWAKYCEDGRNRMRIDKPHRQLTMDGETATMIIGHSYVTQIKTSAYACFNSDWLSSLMMVNGLLENELKMAQNDKKHEISVYHEEINGQDKLILRRHSQANVPKGDYLRNKFLEEAERTFYYYFDPETKLLEGMRLVVHIDEQDILIFEITDIEYNPEIADAHFTLEIPKDAIYHKEPQILPDNEKYAKMTPKEAALAFFTACAQENWDEYLKFTTDSRVDEWWKRYLGGLEIVSIGEPFQSKGYRGGWYIPYEIKLKSGSIKKHNLALRNDNPAKRWVVDGGI
jgi:hypothetical protein